MKLRRWGWISLMCTVACSEAPHPAVPPGPEISEPTHDDDAPHKQLDHRDFHFEVTEDAGVDEVDAGVDAGAPDAGTRDAGVADAGVPDAGVPDAGVPDAGTDAGVDA